MYSVLLATPNGSCEYAFDQEMDSDYGLNTRDTDGELPDSK